MSLDRTALWLSSVHKKQSTEDVGNNAADADLSGLRINASCSDIFRQTMQDLHPIVKGIAAPVTEDKFDSVTSYDEHETSSSESEEKCDDQLIMTPAGRRAWNRLRLYVDEEAVRRRNNETTMNWRFVREVVRVLPQVQQTRTELYRRYLEKPYEWLDGLINCPEYLKQRRQLVRPQQQVEHSPQQETDKNHRPYNKSCARNVNEITKSKHVAHCHQFENKSERVKTTGRGQLPSSSQKNTS